VFFFPLGIAFFDHFNKLGVIFVNGIERDPDVFLNLLYDSTALDNSVAGNYHITLRIEEHLAVVRLGVGIKAVDESVSVHCRSVEARNAAHGQIKVALCLNKAYHEDNVSAALRKSELESEYIFVVLS
jgi:hypothetical protein